MVKLNLFQGNIKNLNSVFKSLPSPRGEKRIRMSIPPRFFHNNSNFTESYFVLLPLTSFTKFVYIFSFWNNFCSIRVSINSWVKKKIVRKLFSLFFCIRASPFTSLWKTRALLIPCLHAHAQLFWSREKLRKQLIILYIFVVLFLIFFSIFHK